MRSGAILAGILAGFVGYFEYRTFLKKNMLLSEGLIRFEQKLVNLTPWHEMYLTWYRMPDEEYEVYHRFIPYYVIGQIDHSKEILIPKQKRINGQLLDGYDVINPLYTYEGGKIKFKELFQEKDEYISIERAALIFHRGWIPHSLKDKRSRPYDRNTRELVKVKGVFLRGKDLHDYKRPNNPDNNQWFNLALEDIALYWELPNHNECKFFYFQQVEMDGVMGVQGKYEDEVVPYPLPPTPTEIIFNYYNWKIPHSWTWWNYHLLGGFSLFSFGIAALTL